jgi:photosystem II stability/assembly factor-like uncharacterized protein
MRALLLLVLVLAACTTQPNAGASPTPSPTASPTATPTQTPTSSPTASPPPIPLPSFAQISAPSGTVVWVLVAGSRLFRSSDRGETWVERSVPAGVRNAEVAFADDTNGLLLSVANPATDCQSQALSIRKTAAGAASWPQAAAGGIAVTRCKRGLASADATHAFFTASTPTDPVVIYRTADVGATWTASTPLPAAPGETAVFALPGRPKAFGSVVLLDASGGQQSKDVFRSTDGGATFAFASKVPTFEGTVAFVTATRWVQIAPPSSSMETTDGGVSWHAYTTDYSQAAPIAPDIVFGDASVGYATVRGAIQRTTDGGAHWTTIKTPGTT